MRMATVGEAACSNCQFGIDVKSAVVCQRYPPFPVHMRGETYDPGDTLQGFWPRVSPEEKCGEHKFRTA